MKAIMQAEKAEVNYPPRGGRDRGGAKSPRERDPRPAGWAKPAVYDYDSLNHLTGLHSLDAGDRLESITYPSWGRCKG